MAATVCAKAFAGVSRVQARAGRRSVLVQAAARPTWYPGERTGKRLGRQAVGPSMLA